MALEIGIIPTDLDLTNALPTEKVEWVMQISLPDFPDVNTHAEHFHKFTIDRPVDEEVTSWYGSGQVTYLHDIIDQAARQRPDSFVLDYRVFVGNEQYIKWFSSVGFDVLLYIIQGTELDLDQLI